jgi:DNA-binding transcriptional LysR family regulator
MNVIEIQAFVSIARLGGVTRAAGRLHRSQPAITRRIKLLESQLGAPLLERGRDGVTLTEAGVAFLPYAEAVLAALKDGAEAVRALHEEGSGMVSLALVGTLAATMLVDQLKRFALTHKNVRLELRTANSQEVGDLVRRGEVSFGLRYFSDPSPELISREISQEKMVVACAPEHRWAGRHLRDLRQLRDDYWVAFPVDRNRRDSFAHLVDHQLTMAHLDGAKILEIDSLTAQKRLVEAGFGIALLPESGIQEELRLGTLKVIDAPGLRTAVPVFAICRKKGYFSAASRALLSLITRVPVKPLSRPPRSKPRIRAARQRARSN